MGALLVLGFFVSLAVAPESPNQPAESPITNVHVVAMVKGGLPESTILLAIQNSASRFDTSPAALIELKDSGVTQTVIEVTGRDEMVGIVDRDLTLNASTPTVSVGDVSVAGTGDPTQVTFPLSLTDVTAEVSASPELRRPILGPLRRSLETLRTSLSAPGAACRDADRQPGVASDEADRRNGTSCLPAAQVSGSPPTAPSQPSQDSWLVYLVGTLALALIGWLISLL
jgi:hypothetical protein